MRKTLWVAAAMVALLSGGVLAQEKFSVFINGQTAATQPLGAGDKVPVFQNGTTSWLPGTQFVTINDPLVLTNKTINCNANICTIPAGSIIGTLPPASGGTGLTSYISGGLLFANSPASLASSGAGTVNRPVIWGGPGVAPGAGGVTGNTTTFATNTGTNTFGHGVSWDINGNLVDNPNAPFTNLAQIWTGAQTFNTVVGAQNNQSGTTYPLVATDCGKTLYLTNAAPITLTLPNSLPVGCTIAVEQAGAGQVIASAATGASFNSSHNYTKTFGQYAVIGLYVDTNSGGSAAHYILTGDGA